MPEVQNPFPGMNPFLEASWLDVHTRLIAYVSDALAERLPADLIARTEERVEIDDLSETSHHRADVLVTEGWQGGGPNAWGPFPAAPDLGAIAIPEIVETETGPEKWIEIRTRQGKVITVIEVLSPWNKQGIGATAYRDRQRRYLEAGINFVEVDLSRDGQHVISVPAERLKTSAGAGYVACATRGGRPQRHEVYACPLRNPLPVIAIPLRSSDPDVPLQLQPLVDRCYKMGRHDTDQHDFEAIPPFEAEDEAWVRERLKRAGIAG